MENKLSEMASFRAGDRPRREPKSAPANLPDSVRHFPFLEKLIESDEPSIEQFQETCQSTCRGLDSTQSRQADPESTAMCQAALSAYGHSLKLLSELLEIKYEKLREQAGEGK